MFYHLLWKSMLRTKRSATSFQGPPGCGESPVILCIMYPMDSEFSLKTSKTGFKSIWFNLWILYVDIEPGDSINHQGSQDPESPKGNYENPSISKPVSDLPNHGSSPRGDRKTTQLDTEITRIPTSVRKLFLHLQYLADKTLV